MKGFWPVFRKELYGMFMSPIFYVVAFIFLLVSGVFFNFILTQVVMVSFQVAQHPELAQRDEHDGVIPALFLVEPQHRYALYRSSFNNEAVRGRTQKRHNRTAVHLSCDRCSGRRR